MAAKLFKSHNSQLRILRSRGLIVKSSVKQILEAEKLICLKEFLPSLTRGEFADTIKQIDKDIDRLQNSIHTVSINDILVMIGFPANWKTL